MCKTTSQFSQGMNARVNLINIDMMTLMQCDVSWMGGLVIYGGLRRRNERDSESRSLMLEFLPRFLHRFMSK